MVSALEELRVPDGVREWWGDSGVGAVPATPRLEREGVRSLMALLLTRRKFALGAAEYIVLVIR